MVIKGTASKISFKMVDETTYLPLSGLTVTTELSIDGGAFGATTNSSQEIGNGWYYVELTAIETDYDEMVLKATATGAAQSDGIISPQPIISTTTNVTQMGGGGGGAAALFHANQCVWNHKDSVMVTAFFKKYSSYMKTMLENGDPTVQMDVKLSNFINETDYKFTELDTKISELLKSVEKIELLLLKNATLDDVEGIYGSI
jgi:hypothetical protein